MVFNPFIRALNLDDAEYREKIYLWETVRVIHFKLYLVDGNNNKKRKEINSRAAASNMIDGVKISNYNESAERGLLVFSRKL